MCIKIIQHSMRDWGKTYKTQCNKPIYKDDMCYGHYNRSIEKSKNWIDRDNYIECTINEFLSGRSLKLKNSHVHIIYRYHKDTIERYNKSGVWVKTDLPLDYTLFCVKIY